MPTKVQKNTKLQKILLIVFLLVIFIFSGTPKVEATVWPGVDPAIQMGLDEIGKLVDGLMLGAMKQAAITGLNLQMDIMAGTSSGGKPAFIVNWESYLVNEPQNRTSVYMNDYISRMANGRNTYSGYSTEGFTGPVNYAANLAQSASGGLNQFLNPNQNTQKVSYEGDPSQMFDGGNFKNMESYLSGVNNPWGFNIAIQSTAQKKLSVEISVAQAQAIANQGFTGIPGPLSGTSILPGILMKERMAAGQRAPQDAITGAKSFEEISSSFVTGMISQSVTFGFSSVQGSIAKSASSSNKYSSGINSMINSQGPGARFGN
jgi:hypothetical protein